MGPGANPNPNTATRRAGACFGCLYKQHTSLTVPPNLSWMHDRLEAQRDVHVGAADSLAEAVGGNERAKSYDYCALVGNVLTSYESFVAFRRGDHATSEVRIVGASAWNPPPTKTTARGSFVSFSSTASRSAKLHAAASQNNNPPFVAPLSSEMSPPPSSSSTSGQALPSPSPAQAQAQQQQQQQPLAHAAPAKASTGPPTFRLVTYAGTHIYCSAPTPADRDTWLAALHAGMEASLANCAETLSSITQSSSAADLEEAEERRRRRRSGGGGNGGGGGGGRREKKERPSANRGKGGPAATPSASRGRSPPKHVREPSVASNDRTILTPPVPQRQSRIGQALRRSRKLVVQSQQQQQQRQANGQPSSSASSAAAAAHQNLAYQNPSPNSNAVSSHGYAPPYESTAPPSAKHCISCGRYPPETACRPSSAPLPQYGMECRVDLCADCLISQGLFGHVTQVSGLYAADAHERAALTGARDLAVECVDRAERVAAEEEVREGERRKEEERTMRERTEGMLAVAVAEAGAREIGGAGGSAAAAAAVAVAEEDGSGGERSSSTEGTGGSSSWTNVDSNSHGTATTEGDLVVEDAGDEDRGGDGGGGGEGEQRRRRRSGREDQDRPAGSPLSGSWADVSHGTAAAAAAAAAAAPPFAAPRSRQSEAWVNLPPAPSTTTALLGLVASPDFQTLRRRSRILEWNCRALEGGGIGCAAEFLDSLHEHAREASASAAVSAEEVEMKKEALRHAGDMGAAIRLLKESALRGTGGGGGGGATGSGGSTSTDTLACVLEFLLDLCEEGELAAVAFFWPQLRQIHLQTLPPTDAGSLVRAELVEDFLLTVAVRHSVHLGLELVWGCIADLEESLGTPNMASPACRRRRFAVLRFVCELESLLFDFDGGWGGGSVSLRAMLSPSQHQAVLIKDAVSKLQLHRIYGSHHLSRSVRLEKLRKEADIEDVEARAVEAINDKLWSDSASSSSESDGLDPAMTATRARAETSDSVVAMNRVRIATNADYFSSQLMFTRRLGDIAERMRFTEVEQRTGLLQHELDVLNSSGRMGGDPLNRICDADGAAGGLAHVVHVPSSEGHVFRSKERTPVLLLMELIREESSVMKCGDRDTDEGDTGNSDDDSMPQEHVYGSDHADDSIHASETPDGAVCSNGFLDEDEDAQTPPVSRKIPIPGPMAGEEEQQQEVEETPPETDDAETDDDNMHEEGLSIVSEGTAKVATGGLDHGADVPLSPLSSPKPSLHKVLESPRKGNIANLSGNSTKISPTQIGEMEDLVVSMMQNNLHIPELEGDGGVTHHLDSKEKTAIKTDEQKTADITSRQPSSPKPSGSSPTQKLSQGRRKVSAFSGAFTGDSMDEMPNLSAHGEGRREVLTTIFLKGIRSSNLVARNAAPAAQRAVQAMDRKRAVELINKTSGTDERQVDTDDEGADMVSGFNDVATGDEFNASGGISTNAASMVESSKDDDDEAMEALRLLIIQNRVAQGNLSPEKAARVLALETQKATTVTAKLKQQIEEDSEEVVDAGDFDPRLAGCGTLPKTVLNALKLWQSGVITSVELLDLVHKDNQFLRHSLLPGAENASKLMEDSAFWGRFAFGERWAEKRARIQTSSPNGATPGWDLVGCIVKSNDDLRQEAFVMQLIELCQEAFQMSGLELWVHPYRILATGRTTGIIELVRNAMSFDSLKKRPGYGNGGLRGHLQRMTEYAADPTEAFETAQRNFVRSLASYSLMSYLFLFKDRHNGNLMLDTAGHVVHIDFGFVFGIAPGGSFSLEQAVPFKLTEEMLEVMGGPRSPLFSEFVTLFCCGFLALQAHAETFITLVEITCDGSSFKCFEGRESSDVVAKLRERFCTHMDKEATIVYALDLIKNASTSYGTKQYDYFQYLSQGIAS